MDLREAPAARSIVAPRHAGAARPSIVLLNPQAAGGRAAALAGPMRAWLAEHAPDVLLIESDSIERSRAALQCLPRSSRVVLVGGDGTLHHMLPVLLTHRLALGVVPMGGGNDAARALGVHTLPWTAALELALRGPTRRMDVGELLLPQGRVPFISSLAVGFDAAVAARAGRGPARLGGLARYLWATLAELLALRHHTLRLRADETLVHDGRALFTSVFNTPTYGSGMPAMPPARIADAKLDLLVAGDFGRLGALAILPRLLRGTHLGQRGIATRRLQSLAIDSDEPLPIAADGEPIAASRRLEVRVRASAVAVVSARPLRSAGAPAAAHRARAAAPQKL